MIRRHSDRLSRLDRKCRHSFYYLTILYKLDSVDRMKRVGEVNYVIHTPGCRKTHHLYHINLLKGYHEADNVFSVATIAPVYVEEDTTVSENSISTNSVMINGSCTLRNSEILLPTWL